MRDEEKKWEWEQSDSGELTEEKREQYYWRLSVVFLVLSPLTFLGIFQDEIVFSMNFPIFLFSVVIGLPVAIMWEIILGRIAGFGSTQKFFIKHPTVVKSFIVKTDPSNLPRIIMERLQVEYFNARVINPEENAGEIAKIQFQKKKNSSALNVKFMDHGFYGEIVISRELEATAVHIRLTMEDTLIMDTGETNKLRDICTYIATGSREFASPTIPSLINAALSLCTVAIILGIIGAFVPSMNMGWPFVFSIIGGSSALVSCIMILFQPRSLMGIRLSIMGMILGSVPFFSILIRLVLREIM